MLDSLDGYLSFVGKAYCTVSETGASGDDFCVLRRSLLGRLRSPLRRPTVLDRWAPLEVALFESGICLLGKDFGGIAAVVATKTEQEVIEFYYHWKKTRSYTRWKATFRPPVRA